jgi:DNA-binding NarL/FixJ family response regulator
VALIRAVVVTLSPMVVDLVTALLSGHAVLDVVARFDSHDGVEAQLAATSPDLILYGLQNGESVNIAPALLTLLPSSKIIVFSNDGRNAYVYTMRPNREVLLDLSPRVLVRAILDGPYRPAI